MMPVSATPVPRANLKPPVPAKMEDIGSAMEFHRQEIQNAMQKDEATLLEESLDFLAEIAPPSYTLWTLDRKFVTFDSHFWEECEYLKQRSPTGELVPVRAPAETVEDLKHQHNRTHYPPDLSRVLKVFALAKKLEHKKIVREFIQLFKMGTLPDRGGWVRICDVPLPADCSNEFFKKLWARLRAESQRARMALTLEPVPEAPLPCRAPAARVIRNSNSGPEAAPIRTPRIVVGTHRVRGGPYSNGARGGNSNFLRSAASDLEK